MKRALLSLALLVCMVNFASVDMANAASKEERAATKAAKVEAEAQREAAIANFPTYMSKASFGADFKSIAQRIGYPFHSITNVALVETGSILTTSVDDAIKTLKEKAIDKGADGLMITSIMENYRGTAGSGLFSIETQVNTVYALAIKRIDLTSDNFASVLQETRVSPDVMSMSLALMKNPKGNYGTTVDAVMQIIAEDSNLRNYRRSKNQVRDDLYDDYQELLAVIAKIDAANLEKVLKSSKALFASVEDESIRKPASGFFLAAFNSSEKSAKSVKAKSEHMDFAFKLLIEGRYPDIAASGLETVVKKSDGKLVGKLQKILRYNKFADSRLAAARVLIKIGESNIVDDGLAKEEDGSVRDKMRELLMNG